VVAQENFFEVPSGCGICACLVQDFLERSSSNAQLSIELAHGGSIVFANRLPESAIKSGQIVGVACRLHGNVLWSLERQTLSLHGIRRVDSRLLCRIAIVWQRSRARPTRGWKMLPARIVHVVLLSVMAGLPAVAALF
jgi:hypothetical protein